ncbi:MAG: hypothetical protein H0X66_07925 [Verrucomicrobia bacterium]|nr:hypothetical protein [Verrucomicrobiota bacterium]
MAKPQMNTDGHRYGGVENFRSALIVAVLFASIALAQAQTFYTNNFQKAEIGKVPEDLMVLDGQFTVQEEEGNKFLELPGSPTDTYTVMFGPVTNANVAVSARIFSTSKGRRMPAFGVALCGVGGYKLQISAAKKAVELFKGEQVMQTMEYTWKSGEWSSLHLAAVQTRDGVKVEGKVSQGGAEPIHLSFEDTALLTPGKASISGTPFAGTTIRFDDLAVVAAGKD